ncbi:MAG: hypothetical protein QOF19_2204, partial [Alphaproteobacteria bacterium]|nr:hypothetical protein [Alphaproteobacteria bacterium]
MLRVKSLYTEYPAPRGGSVKAA